MNKEELQAAISALDQGLEFDLNGEWLNIQVEADKWKLVAQQLKVAEKLYFDYLFCLTCVDWKTHLTMVYHLSSMCFKHQIVVKVKLDRAKPEIESVSDIWKTALFHEREVFEMFGVEFLNHPDLRLLILPEGWEGKNPLRKDFEDPINMIKL